MRSSVSRLSRKSKGADLRKDEENMRSVAALLLGMCACAAARARAPPGPRETVPTLGDALDIRAPKEYLGKDMQVVMEAAPLSANRRILQKKTGTFKGMRRRRGLTVWMKKRDKYPWENPWAEPSEAPFKLRYFKHDPVGIALSMEKEGKLQIQTASYKGKTVLGVGLTKPKPWYSKFLPDRSK